MAKEVARKHNKKNVYWVAYVLLALVILLPLLRPGFVLMLDLVFTPILRMPDQISSSYLLHAVLHALNLVLPSEIIEKLLLLAILLLCGVGMHRLVRYVSSKKLDTTQEMGAYFAGLFYTLNPFTYDRFMTGQYNVLFGYALIPFFVQALLTFLQKPAWRTASTVALWAIVIAIVSVHTVGLIAVVSLVATGWMLWKRRSQKAHVWTIVRFGLASLAIFIVVSSYWIVPLVMGKGSTATKITSFTAGDQQTFATIGDNAIFKLGNIVRLQGFWAETQGLYTLPQEQIPAWGLLAVMLWVIIIIGGVHAWKSGYKGIVKVTLVTMFIAALVALGIFNSWLATHLPLFAGYREPQKFVALIAFGYALLSAWGVAAILRSIKERSNMGGAIVIAAILLFLIPTIFTAKMIWGGNGQLRANKYPADWTAMNKQLNRLAGNGQTLFLPWHLYMYYEFAGRIIASPAPDFFDKPVIVSANPEFGKASPVNETSPQRQLNNILAHASDNASLGAQLAPLHIKYILLAREDDANNYTYLDKQRDLQLVSKSDTLELYRNNAYKEN